MGGLPQHPPIPWDYRRGSSREEAAIATTWDRSIDQALKTHKARSRLLSLVILLLGLIVAAAILLSSGRRRERAANRIRLGDDSSAVVALLGAPAHRCPAGTLAHLVGRFPGGTPRVTIDASRGELREATAARWIYPDSRRGSCAPNRGDVEVGLDRQGKVLWIVPVHGRKTLVLPPAQ
jgi:hypothetical protein